MGPTRRPPVMPDWRHRAGAGHNTSMVEPSSSPRRALPDGSRPARSVPRWLRVLLPAVLILVWLTGAGVGGPYFGRVNEVSTNDQTTFLPSSADATRVQQEFRRFNDSTAIPAVIVLVGAAKLTPEQVATSRDVVAGLTSIPGVAEGSSPLIPSADGLALQAFVPIDTGSDVGDTVAAVEKALQSGLPGELRSFVTGPAGFSADLGEAFSGIDGLLLLVALAAVFVILILVYRSALLPIAVLATSISALTVALLTVWWLAKAEILLLSGQTQGILFILVIGAATDYSLLYVSRYREELRLQQDKWTATRRALGGSVEPILASGGTVIAGLLCLLLSDLKSNSTLGPVAAIGIAFAMLSALTLLPAILFALGRVAFWPKQPRYQPGLAAEAAVPTRGLWARVGRQVRRRPRLIWVVTGLVLLAGATGVTQLRAEGISQSDLVLTASQARDGQRALGEHFPGGSGSPVNVLAPADQLQPCANRLLSQPGISAVSVLSKDSPSASAPVTAEGIRPMGPPGTPVPVPTQVDGRVLLQATLLDPADSDAAQQTVRELRTAFAADNAPVLIGGVTATAIDTNDASIHDRNLIIPIVLAVILVILMLLLRSVLAPVLLILTTGLSFGTALGVSALVFDGIFKFAGADPAVPLFGFVFLVALGIDYNIFLATRVREESLRHGTREGIIRGLSVTGGVITSAGLVLAATFAALSVIPILFLVQIAFIVAFGVLLDTFLVRALLVPALMYDIGPAVWWPSKRLMRGADDPRHADAEIQPPVRTETSSPTGS